MDHDGLIRTCAKLQAALHPVPGDPRLLKTMAETILAHVEKRTNEYGVEYTRDVHKPGGFGLQEPYELAVAYLASSPAWRDRPTGPGIYWNGNCAMEVTQERFDRLDQVTWGHGRVYGPIPSDTQEGT